MIVVLIILICVIFYVGVKMDNLLAAIARLQISVNTAVTKITTLKAGQPDPAALQAAADTLNSAADALDAANS